MLGCAVGAYVDDCKYRHIAGHVYYTGVTKYKIRTNQKTSDSKRDISCGS